MTNDFVKPFITEAKAHLRGLTDVAAAFEDVRSVMLKDVDAIDSAQAKGQPIVPEIAYADVADGKVTDAQRADIRKRGCAIVRGVFDRDVVRGWNDDVGEYIDRNDYLTKAKEKAGLDTYFSDLKAGAPQTTLPMRIAPDAGRPVTRLWVFRRIWILAATSDGSIRPIKRSTAIFLRGAGKTMIRGRRLIGRKRASFLRQRSVPCSARSKVGLR